MVVLPAAGFFSLQSISAAVGEAARCRGARRSAQCRCGVERVERVEGVERVERVEGVERY